MDAHAEDLLIAAIVLPAPEAEQHWREWRASADLDRLDEAAVLAFPLLGDRLPDWLEGDPARTMLLGICKRSWSRNQIKLKELAGILKRFREAGIARVAVAGSVAWTFYYAPSPRPVESLELLVRRGEVGPASRVLKTAGWSPEGKLPTNEELDRVEGIWFARGADRLKLSWRLLPWSEEVAAEREELRGVREVHVHDEPVGLPSAEDMLLCALVGYRDEREVEWRCDAMQLASLRSTRVRIDWRHIRRMLLDRPEAIARLQELKQNWNADIPPGVFRGKRKWEAIRSDYRWRARELGQRRSVTGFILYLGDRWRRVFLQRS
jgi:hypothetical protein